MVPANTCLELLASVPLDLNSTLGATLIGIFLCSILYGITIVQVYTFYYFSEDRRWIKTLVFVMWLLATSHLVLLIQPIYANIVGDYLCGLMNLDAITWDELTELVVETVLNGIVRGLFCLRVWRLSSGNLYFIVPTVASTVANFVIGFVSVAIESQWNNFETLSHNRWLFYASSTTSLMADIFISVSQIYSLWRQRSDFQATNNVVRLFMLYSLNTGVIVTLCAVESLATFAIMPNNEIYQAVYILLSPLLLNALLATYNLKWTVRGEFLNNGLQRPVSKDPLPFFNLKSKTHRRDTDCDEVLEVRIETARETSADWTAGP